MAPRWALFWSIVVCMALYFLLTGCATTLDHREHLLWNDCAGNSRSSYVEVRTGFPPIACPALALEHDAPLLALHLGLELRATGLQIRDLRRSFSGQDRGAAGRDHQVIARIDPVWIRDPLIHLPDLRPGEGVAKVLVTEIPEGISGFHDMELAPLR